MSLEQIQVPQSNNLLGFLHHQSLIHVAHITGPVPDVVPLNIVDQVSDELLVCVHVQPGHVGAHHHVHQLEQEIGRAHV